jgi:lysophospholipase L1-like esterase
MDTRRVFLKKATFGGVAMLGLSNSIIASAMSGLPQSSKIALNEHDTVLFQGDSITDAGRDKKVTTPNTSPMMGSGYVLQTAGALLHQHAEKQLTIYNKGISGNKVYQLAERWDAECIELKPNILSILVGVNDFWHTKSHDYKGTSKKYAADYRALLQRTKKALPDVKIIIGEPFAVKGVKAVDESWYPAFDEYRAMAQQIATEFGAFFIPYQKVFNEAQKRAPSAYWTHDGVHASLAGAQLMADAWLQAIA